MCVWGGGTHTQAVRLGRERWHGGGRGKLGRGLYPGDTRELLKVMEQWRGMVRAGLEVTPSATYVGEGGTEGPPLQSSSGGNMEAGGGGAAVPKPEEPNFEFLFIKGQQ